MKISKHDREQAAIYCSAMACWWTMPMGTPMPFDFSDDGAKLARLAAEHAFKTHNYNYAWAAAEALLRTGWVPNG